MKMDFYCKELLQGIDELEKITDVLKDEEYEKLLEGFRDIAKEMPVDGSL